MSKVCRSIACPALAIMLTMGLAAGAAAQETPVPQPVPEPPVAEPQAPVVVELAAVGAGEGSGEAILEAAGEQTNARLEVEGLAPGTQWSGFLVAGTCDQPRDVIAPLGTIEVADQGSGRGEAAVTTALAELAVGPATVQVHPQGETPTQAVLCGALPAAGPSVPVF
jgi:hypothetical protein